MVRVNALEQYRHLENDPLFYFEENGWKYFKYEKLPQLVLAVEVKPEHNELPECSRPQFNTSRTWYPICHKTAGNGCYSRYLWATLLEPRPDVLRGLFTLNNRYKGSLCGWLSRPSFDSLVAYRKSIQSLVHPHANCNRTYQDLAEAFYPFDLDCLNLLSSETLPEDLDTLLEPQPELLDPLDLLSLLPNYSPKWKLLMLGQNCD